MITNIKTKSGDSVKVAYCVEGTLENLTPEQIQALALRQLRAAARGFVVQKLVEAEPAIMIARAFRDRMINAKFPEEMINAFFNQPDKEPMPLELPTEFHIPIAELIPGESTRGRKSGDLFSLDVVEGDADGDNDETTEESAE